MSRTRKEMETWAAESLIAASQVEEGLAQDNTVSGFLRTNAQAWSRFARILSRMQRHLKSNDPAMALVIELETENAALKAARASSSQ